MDVWVAGADAGDGRVVHVVVVVVGDDDGVDGWLRRALDEFGEVGSGLGLTYLGCLRSGRAPPCSVWALATKTGCIAR